MYLKFQTNYIYDNTYARTIHNNCPNKNCDTKKNKKLKEAIFFNNAKSLTLIYICTVCKTNW